MKSVALSRSLFTNLQLAAVALVLSFIFVSMVTPTHARAAGLTQEQVNAVVSLLESFNTDPATIARVSRALGASTSVASSTAASATVQNKRQEIGARPLCELLKRELRRGNSGDDVRELQKLLLEEGDYAEGLITGFFGERTEAAVKRLQARLGIVASGDSLSTGYGLVGAKTRAALIARCAGGDKIVFKVSPLSGKAPLTVEFKVDKVRSADGKYTIVFGDGTQVVATEAKHIYNNTGVYTAQLLYATKPACALATSTPCMAPESVRTIGKATIMVGDKKIKNADSSDDEDEPEDDSDEDADVDESDEDVEEDDTTSRAPSAAGILLASVASSIAMPFDRVTDALADAFLNLGLY